MRIVFMGTPPIAANTLNAIYEAGHEVPLVVTQPSKKKGRGMTIMNTPVMDMAQQLGIPVLAPESMRNNAPMKELVQAEADFYVVIAYGRILPREILDIPKHACLNIHYSLLPKYRGASPVHHALLSNDKETGVAVIKMDEGMDTGDVLKNSTTSIRPDETRGELESRLEQLGIQCLLEVISDYEQLSPVKQDESQATYTAKISKDKAIVDWKTSATIICCLSRALTPGPGAQAFFRGKRVKLISMRPIPISSIDHDHGADQCGTVIDITSEGIVVGCGEASRILITRIKPENKSEMDSLSFINGYQIKVGTQFNSATE